MKMIKGACLSAFLAVSAVSAAQAEMAMPGFINDFSENYAGVLQDAGASSDAMAGFLDGHNIDVDLVGERRAHRLIAAVADYDAAKDHASVLVDLAQRTGIDEKGDLAGLAPHQAFALEFALMATGHFDGVVDGQIDKQTLQAAQQFYEGEPLSEHDTELIQNYVEQNIPLVLEGGAIRPDIDAAPMLAEEALTEAFQDLPFQKGSLGSNPDMHAELQNITAGLVEKLSGVSLSNEALMDADPVHYNGDEAYLMVPPDDNVGSLENRMEARLNWEIVRDTIEDNGGRVDVVAADQIDAGTRETWTRDASIIIGDYAYFPDIEYMKNGMESGAIKTHFKGEDAEVRALRQAQMMQLYEARGLETMVVEGAWFEGGNIVLHESAGGQNTLFMGLESWASEASVERLVGAINKTQDMDYKGVGVSLVDTDTYYHLDLAFSPQLSNGEHFIYAGAISPDAYLEIIDIVGAEKLMDVSAETAETFALNMVEVGNGAIIPTAETDELKELAEQRGYKIDGPAVRGMSSYEYGRGGVHCITSEYKPKL